MSEGQVGLVAHYASVCPVTRADHEWLEYGGGGGRCTRCDARMASLEEEWRAFKAGEEPTVWEEEVPMTGHHRLEAHTNAGATSTAGRGCGDE